MTYSPKVRNMIKGSSGKNGHRLSITARREGVSVICANSVIFLSHDVVLVRGVAQSECLKADESEARAER